MTDLPRGWMLCDLGGTRVSVLEDYIAQAALWGFERPDNLTNHHKRCKWIQKCREKAWDILAGDQGIKQAVSYKPRAAKPAKATRSPKSLCEISASDVNAFLREATK